MKLRINILILLKRLYAKKFARKRESNNDHNYHLKPEFNKADN